MPAARKRPRASSLRERFIRSVAAESCYHVLFEHIPGVAFFMKDRRSRLVAANRHFYERLGFRSERELIGKDDFALFPARLAEHFRRDDGEVLRTGRAKLNIIELFFNRQGIPDWFLTHKLPVRDRRGRVIGIIGVTQSYGFGGRVREPYLAIDRAVSLIRGRFRERLTIGELAAAAHLSPRQLHRKFIETFGSSPQSFILKVRIQAACEFLQQGDKLISEIARASGFGDQSSFTQHFRGHLGMTPRRYRQRYRLVRRQGGS
jgi:PAS domain S-box-containing protein